MAIRLVVSAMLVVGFVSAAFADETAEVVRLTITPAVEPLPALKYQLLPKFIDRRPGNAALDYARAAFSYKPSKEFEAGVAEWLKASPAEFDRLAKTEKLFADLDYAGALNLVKLGARCMTCDFQPPLRDQNNMMILLPEIGSLRKLARLGAVKARLSSRARKYDETLELLQTGYAMARHLGSEPTFVTALAGLSIASLMDQVHLDLMQRRGAPSLYWAVTFRPNPIVDLRPALEADMYSLEHSYREFAEIDQGEFTAEEWNRRLSRWIAEWYGLRSMMVDINQPFILHREPTTLDKFKEQMEIRARAAERRDQITAALLRHGLPESGVRRMSDAERTLRYAHVKYAELRDQLVRWMVLPYPEAAPGLEAAVARFKQAREADEELVPLATLLIPSIASARHTFARAERKHDAFRILEALRLYAGTHDGALPKSLDDVVQVPLPKLDAITGKPFDYALDGDTARLTLPDEKRERMSKLVYEITVAK